MCSQILSECLSLKRAYENQQNADTALLAWRARNLLELSAWSTYCAKSRDNARRIYEDAGRDVRGTFAAFMKWGTATAQAADWLEPLATAKQDLSERALCLDGIESLDGAYKQVSEAAKECGIGEHSSLSYKMLSKFAHPTAMRIWASSDESQGAFQRDCFFSQGCLFFTGSFNAVEGQLSISRAPPNASSLRPQFLKILKVQVSLKLWRRPGLCPGDATLARPSDRSKNIFRVAVSHQGGVRPGSPEQTLR